MKLLITLAVLVILLTLICLSLLVGGKLVLPTNTYKYRIQAEGRGYQVKEYVEKDGCILFNKTRICGNYTITTY